jgi:hypothetical protein
MFLRTLGAGPVFGIIEGLCSACYLLWVNPKIWITEKLRKPDRAAKVTPEARGAQPLLHQVCFVTVPVMKSSLKTFVRIKGTVGVC